jgi:PilZ domain
MPAEKYETVQSGASAAPGEEVKERRGWPRYAIMAMARVLEPRSMAKIEGRCTDLGAGGCYVDSVSAFPADILVQVRISQGQRHIESPARVIYSKAGMGMGLTFTEMELSERAKLESWLYELSGGSEHAPGLTDPAQISGSRALQPTPVAARERAALLHLIDLLARKHHITAREAEELIRELLS